MAKRVILNRIKVQLVAKRKTNIQLSEALNKNISTVSKWATNQRQPRLEELYLIAEFLQVSVYDLLEPKMIIE